MKEKLEAIDSGRNLFNEYNIHFFFSIYFRVIFIMVLINYLPQDNYFEEAFKMRNVLEEFLKTHRGQRRPTILGLSEHIFILESLKVQDNRTRLQRGYVCK